jgi:hypothetical protein
MIGGINSGYGKRKNHRMLPYTNPLSIQYPSAVPIIPLPGITLSKMVELLAADWEQAEIEEGEEVED